MTGDELERAIEFLLKNQAAFDARHAAFDARMDRLEAAQTETRQQISELTVSQHGTQQQLDHLTNIVASIAETTRRNAEDIDALVKLVGGIIEGRNGKSES
ncbi:MAG TPA: hypothetical protein VD835_12080 [Pyrinomonadaceae bacterium]|nr:hypothetical protein [Pyrinomonadaceae bacterium]